jgi:hypothetical protein
LISLDKNLISLEEKLEFIGIFFLNIDFANKKNAQGLLICPPEVLVKTLIKEGLSFSHIS